MTTTANFIDVRDDEYVEIAQLRSEVMRARGYDVGETKSTQPTLLDHVEQSLPVVLVAEPEPHCVVCQNAIPAERKRAHPRAVTCSDSCSHKRTMQRQKAYNQRWSSSERKAATVTVISSETSLSASEMYPNGHILPTQGGDSSRLVSIVSQLTAAGLRCDLQLDGVSVAVHA